MRPISTGLKYLGWVVAILICATRTIAASPQFDQLIEFDNANHIILSPDFSWSYKGILSGDEMGFSVSGAGDVNGDGFDDVIIGSPKYTIEIDPEGAAFVFYGTSQGLRSIPDWMSDGDKGSRYGDSVSGAGDVNGDGFDDVIIGSPDYRVDFGLPGIPQSGAVFVYYGSADGLVGTPSWDIYAEAPDISLGDAVSEAGDVNNDGYDDIVVGAWKYESDSFQANEGKVYLYLGGPDGLSADPDWSFECNSLSASCGKSLGAAGDVNGDGFDDVIVGAPNYDGTFDQQGAAYLFYGNSLGLNSIPDWVVLGGQEDAGLGSSVDGAGDVNGDGFDDVIVGAQYYSTEEIVTTGAAFGFYGSEDGLNPTRDWEVYGTEKDSQFGCSVHAAGDINQDGYGDVLVGANKFGVVGSPDSQPDEGAAFLYHGSPSGLEAQEAWMASGEKADALFGHSVSAAGDVNGDALEDVIIGAPDYKSDDKTPLGIAFAYYARRTTSESLVFIPFILVSSGE